MFSVILNCRVEGNADCKLLSMLDSIQRQSNDYTAFEVLIKFDTDDTKVKDVIPRFTQYPFPIKYIVDRRGRGPMDFHLGFTTLLSIANPSSEFFVPLPDDFEVCCKWDINISDAVCIKGIKGSSYEGWILERLSGTEDVFIIQHQAHPGGTPENQFNMDWDYYDMDKLGFETIPIFSAKLIQLMGGFGQVAFTDAWAILLQHEIKNTHGLNISKFTSSPYGIRMPQAAAMDLMEQANRDGQRAHTFRLMKTSYYRGLIETQAQIIADYHKKYRKDYLEKQFVQTVTNINPLYVYTRNEHGKNLPNC